MHSRKRANDITLRVSAGLLGLSALALATATPAAAAAQDVPMLYAAYAASTKAFKTDWTYGYAQRDAFGGNLAKASSLSLDLAMESYNYGGPDRDALLWSLGFTPAEAVAIELSPSGTDVLGALLLGDPVHGAAANAQAFKTTTLLDDASVIAIRGTNFDTAYEGILDGLLDLDINPERVDGVTYHAGFYNYAEALYPWVLEQAADSCTGEPDAKPLWLTGHSLGGAAATILGYWLREDGCNVGGVVAFGPPRQGQQDYFFAYRDLDGGHAMATTHRFSTPDDVVYCLPYGQRWSHVGLGYELSAGGVSAPSMADPCGDLEEVLPDRLARALGPLLEAGRIPLEIAYVVDQWHRRFLNFVLQCDTTAGQIFSLGFCNILESTGRLQEIDPALSPEEVFLTVLRIANEGAVNHNKYEEYFPNVNFDDDTELDPFLVDPVVLY